MFFPGKKPPKPNSHPLSKLENSPRLAQIQSAKLHKARMANQPHPKNPIGNNSSRCPCTRGRSEKTSGGLCSNIFVVRFQGTYTYIDRIAIITRILTFWVGSLYKPSFATGKGYKPRLYSIHFSHCRFVIRKFHYIFNHHWYWQCQQYANHSFFISPQETKGATSKQNSFIQTVWLDDRWYFPWPVTTAWIPKCCERTSMAKRFIWCTPLKTNMTLEHPHVQ